MDMTRAMGKLSNQDRGGTPDGQMVLRLKTHAQTRGRHANTSACTLV